jgi:hypothetical protein
MRFDQIGSVRMLTPSSCTSIVACPTQVIVGCVPLARSSAPSFASTAGGVPRSGRPFQARRTRLTARPRNV